MKRVLLTLALVSAAVGAWPARAQTDAARLTALARAQLDELNWDSAFGLLQSALQARPSESERVRAFTLLGITELGRENRTAARNSFEQALTRDPSLRIDTLADLH